MPLVLMVISADFLETMGSTKFTGFRTSIMEFFSSPYKIQSSDPFAKIKHPRLHIDS